VSLPARYAPEKAVIQFWGNNSAGLRWDRATERLSKSSGLYLDIEVDMQNGRCAK